MSTLVATELEQARLYFTQTRRRLTEATTGLSEAQARFKPAAESWSIAEILEHLALAHERILTRILEQLPQGAAPELGRDALLIDALVLEKIPDRSIKAKAPEFIHPTGRLTADEALKRILRNHESLLSYLESAADLREHVLDSPPLRAVTNGAYTTLDGYQWALTAVAHDERHVRQIEELKACVGYPR
jgi:hypothetical protein